MKKLLLIASVALCCAAEAAWKGLDEASWYSGPKLTEADLAGKVVLVDEWGVNCPPCRALLPRMEEIWKSFRTKPFVLVGSHRQGMNKDAVMALVKANKLTYPIYERAGIEGEPSNGGGIPFLYVINHRGRVVYSGRSDRDATQALVEAITAVGLPPDLIPGVDLVKYKMLKNKFKLGSNLKSIVKTLEKDIKDAEKKSATKAAKEKAEEARSILAALKDGKRDLETEIENLCRTKPAEAYKLINLFVKTFPEEAAAYKDRIEELKARLAEMKKAGAKK